MWLIGAVSVVGVVAAACGVVVGKRWAARSTREDASRSAARSSDEVKHANRAVLKRGNFLRFLDGNLPKLLTNGVEVRDLMTEDVQTVDAAMPAIEVASLMANRKLRHLLVCGPNRRLMGVISDRDLATRTARTAKELMTASPITGTSDMRLRDAIEVMLRSHISCLPVTHDQRLLGVITAGDIMLAMLSTLDVLEVAWAEKAIAATNEPCTHPA